jgi:hypothetical protein
MCLYADWNNVWYKLIRFYIARFAVRRRPVELDCTYSVVERLEKQAPDTGLQAHISRRHGSRSAYTAATVTAELADKMETLSYQR